MQPKKLVLIQMAVLTAAIPVVLYASAAGPDAATAGVPGESSCSACHSGGSGTGSVSVAFPTGLTYTPGVKQHLVVQISDGKAKRWGFELTARLATSTSTQAGLFSTTDLNTQIVCTQSTFKSEVWGVGCNSSSLPLQYIEHTAAGTRSGTTGSITFEFDWMPPTTDVGNINIYVAANAANGDSDIGGDTIYTTNYTLTAALPTVPTIHSVVNGASFLPGIAPGSWVTIKGTNLAASTRAWGASDFVNGQLPAQLDKVSVMINGNPASVYFISPTQINVQAPDDSTTGPVNVQVTNNGAISDSFSATLQPVSPAFFLWAGKYPVATRYPDNSYIGPVGILGSTVTTAPAKPGDVIILWGTGFGPTNPSTPAGWQVSVASPVANPPTVTIGGVQAQVMGAAISPGSAGLYQVAITVPNVPDGAQPITVQAAGVQSPSGVYLAVHH